MANLRTSVRYKSEEKRRHAIMLAIVLFILGIVMIVIGTYAYYRTSISGTITGSIAVWKFKANNSSTSFRINLQPSQSVTATYTNANSEQVKTIAPGTSGSFSIQLTTIDGNIEGELPVDYTITFSNFSNIPTNLKFYSDSSFQTETNIRSSGYKITGTVGANDTKTKTIYWKWAYGTSASVTNDNAAADKNVSFTVTVVGKQHQL